MPGICSCGTHLVEDALFCHRCGKAQRELLAEQPVEEEPVSHSAISVPKQDAVLPVTFANSVAVRVGFLAASVASMLDALPWMNLLCLLWSALAGYFAVVLYRRRTGQTLSVAGGARMGWITGVLNALIVIVFTTLTFATSYPQQLNSLHTADPASYARLTGVLDKPYILATGILFALFLLFVIFTLAGIAGGALSAKLAEGRKD